jgi:hypothetical protein
LLPPSSRRESSAGFGELIMERHSGAGRPREQQPVDRSDRQGHGPDPALRSAVAPLLWNPCLVEALHQHLTGCGVFSDGLKTTALPAISAGTMWPLEGARESCTGLAPRARRVACAERQFCCRAASIFRCGVRSA